MTKEERLIKKVDALLATAAEGSGATEAERDTALKMAEKLIAKYNLDIRKLGMKKDIPLEKEEIPMPSASWDGGIKVLVALADLHFCNVVSQGSTKQVWIVGDAVNRAIVRKLYEHIMPQALKAMAKAERGQKFERDTRSEWDRMMDQFMGNPPVRTRKEWRASFLRGVGIRIHDMMEAERNTVFGTELVLVDDDEELDRKTAELFGEGEPLQKAGSGRPDERAYGAGMDAAYGMSLRPAPQID